jgi:uncharacterized protein (DUF1499 family)
MPAIRRRTLIRSAQAVATVSIMLTAFRYPIINDVATDLDDPPTFRRASGIPQLPEAFKASIRKAYPDLTTLRLTDVPLADATAAAGRAAARMPRWEVKVADAERLEGVATTRLLRFRDDFTFRFRAHGSGGTAVDGRSRSRLGQGDFGANAVRIRAFFEVLREEAGVTGARGTARL